MTRGIRIPLANRLIIYIIQKKPQPSAAWAVLFFYHPYSLLSLSLCIARHPVIVIVIFLLETRRDRARDA